MEARKGARLEGRIEGRKKGKMGKGAKEKDGRIGVLISPARASEGRGRGERERTKAGRRASGGAGCD